MPKTEAPKLQVDQRLLERQRAVRRQLFLQILKRVLLCFSVAFVVWALLFSPMFKVKEIQLLGLEDAQKSVFIDFQTLNHVFGDAKSDSAVSLVLFDTDNFARQLQQIHGVKKAQVAKEWPHKLIVMIDPKTPIAKANGNLIDENGDILGAWQESLGAFPEFEVSEDAKTDVLALLKMIVKHPAFSQGLTKISATGRDSIAVQRADGLIVVFGNTNDLTLKLESLQIALTQDLQGKRIIDLSAPRDPVAKQ